MSEINKGPLCYGNEVVGMYGRNSLEHWLCTTAWPEQHDQTVMTMRDLRNAIERRGFVWDMMQPGVSEGRFQFIDHGRVITEHQCYCIKFKHPTVTPEQAMAVIYLTIDEDHPDRRTTGLLSTLAHEPNAFKVEEVMVTA